MTNDPQQAINIILHHNGSSRLEKIHILMDALTVVMEGYTVEAHGDRLKDLQVKDIAQLQVEFQNLDEQASKIKATFYKFFDFIRMVVLPDRMEEEGLEGGKIEGVGRVRLLADVQARIPAAMREQAWEWLRDHGHGDLISETVNSSSLKALAKRKLQSGDPLPDKLFSVTPYTKASVTKG